jgi:hypothetical protein
MSYSTKEIWIPTDDSGALDIDAGANSGYVSVKSGGADIQRGVCYGYRFSVSGTDSNNSAIPVQLYDDTSGNLVYSATIDARSLTSHADALDAPIPFFDTPYFVIGNIQSGASASLTYTVQFFFKAMA